MKRIHEDVVLSLYVRVLQPQAGTQLILVTTWYSEYLSQHIRTVQTAAKAVRVLEAVKISQGVNALLYYALTASPGEMAQA